MRAIYLTDRKGDKNVRNKTAKTRMVVRGAIDSPLNSLFGQKISVRDGKVNKKSNKKTKKHASCRSYRYRRQERSSSRTRQVCSQLVFSASVKKLRACCFGIYLENEYSEGFSLFFNKKIFNKLVSSLRCLLVRCRNKFGMTFDYGGDSSRVRRFDAPQGLTPQGLAQC